MMSGIFVFMLWLFIMVFGEGFGIWVIDIMMCIVVDVNYSRLVFWEGCWYGGNDEWYKISLRIWL